MFARRGELRTPVNGVDFQRIAGLERIAALWIRFRASCSLSKDTFERNSLYGRLVWSCAGESGDCVCESLDRMDESRECEDDSAGCVDEPPECVDESFDLEASRPSV